MSNKIKKVSIPKEKFISDTGDFVFNGNVSVIKKMNSSAENMSFTSSSSKPPVPSSSDIKEKIVDIDYSSEKSLSKSTLDKLKECAGEGFDPSFIVVDENGKSITSNHENDKREGASTQKLMVGYAALYLLDPYEFIEVTEYGISQGMGSDRKPGDKIRVIDAVTSCFPLSDNEAVADLCIAIGHKYFDCKSDKQAYLQGTIILNLFFKEAGFDGTNIQNPIGWSYEDIEKASRDNNMFEDDGHMKGKYSYGTTAEDLVKCAIMALNNLNMRSSFKNIDMEEGNEYFYQACKENNIKFVNELCQTDNPSDGIYFIKSGTQNCNSGIFCFVHDGKKYYASVQDIQLLSKDGKSIDDSGANYARYARILYDSLVEENMI